MNASGAAAAAAAAGKQKAQSVRGRTGAGCRIPRSRTVRSHRQRPRAEKCCARAAGLESAAA